MRKVMMKRMGAGKGLGIFNPGIGSGKLKYYCMTCGEQHNQLACPKCGSKNEKSRNLVITTGITSNDLII
jgi:rubrerythrin